MRALRHPFLWTCVQHSLTDSIQPCFFFFRINVCVPNYFLPSTLSLRRDIRPTEPQFQGFFFTLKYRAMKVVHVLYRLTRIGSSNVAVRFSLVWIDQGQSVRPPRGWKKKTGSRKGSVVSRAAVDQLIPPWPVSQRSPNGWSSPAAATNSPSFRGGAEDGVHRNLLCTRLSYWPCMTQLKRRWSQTVFYASPLVHALGIRCIRARICSKFIPAAFVQFPPTTRTVHGSSQLAPLLVC